MQMNGEQRIEAPRRKVWEALNDPDVLRACIPGCQFLEQKADDRLQAVVGVKIGPITARFTGEVVISDRDPPNGYRISGEGSGGAAGFAKGGAVVRLRDEGASTLLSYEVSAEVGGKIAQLGGGLIDLTAKQLAGAFFKKLATVIGQETAPEPEPVSAPSPQSPSPAPAVTSPRRPTPTAAPAISFSPLVAGLLLVACLAAGFLAGLAAGGWSGQGALAGLAMGLFVVVTAAAAFGLGQRSAAPNLVLDAELLARLSALAQERRH
jgi:carbon monoxide dehydrogenase subunit G